MTLEVQEQFSVCWFSVNLSFKLVPFLMISMPIKGILLSTRRSIVNVRLGCGPFRVLRNSAATSALGILARVSWTNLLLVQLGHQAIACKLFLKVTHVDIGH